MALEKAQVDLTAAQSALSTSTGSSDELDDLKESLGALQAQLSASRDELKVAQDAIAKASAEGEAQIDAMSKIHDQVLETKEEEHVHRLNSVQKELGATKESHAKEVAELKEKLLLTEEEVEKLAKERNSSSNAEELSKLHAAHSSKLLEVENGYKTAQDALAEVRFFRCCFVL